MRFRKITNGCCKCPLLKKINWWRQFLEKFSSFGLRDRTLNLMLYSKSYVNLDLFLFVHSRELMVLNVFSHCQKNNLRKLPIKVQNSNFYQWNINLYFLIENDPNEYEILSFRSEIIQKKVQKCKFILDCQNYTKIRILYFYSQFYQVIFYRVQFKHV